MLTLRTRSIVPLILMAVFATPILTRAHNPSVHERLVNDAITYIKNAGTPAQKAALQELVRIAGSEEEVRKQLGEEARLTDNYEDIAYFSNSKTLALFVPFLTGDRTFFKYKGHYITRLQHYLNVDRLPERWKLVDGYYYQWSSKEDSDKAPTASFWVSAGDLEVDNEYSIALPRYQTHWNQSLQLWSRNWSFEFNLGGDDWDIENTRFAPVSALAYYWYRHYVEFPEAAARTQYANVEFRSAPPMKPGKGGRSVLVINKEPRKINQARLLGPALHAAADVTVPHHTMGSSGYGHQTYEDDFQTLYNSGSIRSSIDGVRQQLSGRIFLNWGQESVSAQPNKVDTLQITVVTGGQDGDGTDANVNIDFGPNQVYKLNTDLDDFERWNDDTFTLQVKPNTLLSDLSRVRIKRDASGSSWKLKALYVMVNGVLLYGNSNINQILGSNQEWNARDFVPRGTIDKQIWPIDKVLNNAGEYTFVYTKTEIGEGNMRLASFWNRVHGNGAHSSPDVLRDKTRRMQHLLDLAIANIVRIIEMSQTERGVSSQSFGSGFFRQKDRPEVFLAYMPGSYCHVQNEDQMNAFGGFEKVKVVDNLALSGNNTGACGFPNGFFRRSNQNEVYFMYGPGIPEFKIGANFCHVTNEAQMNAYGGFSQVRVVEPASDLARGRTFTGDCPNP